MRVLRSPYMEWAKTNFTTPPRYNLASSGLGNVPLKELESVTLEGLEITGKSFYGYEPLQAALSKHTGAPPECIFAGTGTSMGNLLTMAASVERGGQVLFEHPVYDLLTSAAGFLEADIRYFHRKPEDAFRIDVEEVARQLTPQTRLIVITNLHNPSSVYTPPGTLAKIGELAKSVGARVLVDEVYLESAFDLAPASAYTLGPEFVITNSLTKVYGLSGLRCGWAISQDADFIRRLWRLNDLFGVIPAHPAELLSVIAFSEIGRLRDRAKAILDRNRAAVNGFLRSIQQPEVEFGTVAFPALTVDTQGLTTTLRERYQTAVVPGSFFDMPRHFRIGFGGSFDLLDEGLRRISKALAERD